MDNLSVGRKKSLEGISADIELMVGDIRNFEECNRACRDVDIVVHLAASTGVAPSVDNPHFDMESNVVGTLNMLEAARGAGVGKFIFASSGAPLGDVEMPIHEGRAPRPVSPYGASKLAGEGYCSAYYRTFGLHTAALRFSNVYGPRSTHKSSVVHKFIKEALSGKTLDVYGDGDQTRDFIYVDDLVKTIILAAKTEIGGEVFQIATNLETTVNEISLLIKELVEKNTDIQVEIVHSEFRKGDVKRNYSDISKAKKFLGFSPKVDLKEGLEKTLNWFVEEHKVCIQR